MKDGKDVAAPHGPVDSDGPALRWTIAASPEGLLVELAGEVDENADFASLRPLLVGAVELSLGGITRVNSCGVREWVNFVHNLPSVTSLSLTRCSPAIVMQLNTIYNFRGPARVRSLLAPYVCERCSVEEIKLVEVEVEREGVPEFACARCGLPMEFDDLPERYLSFLKEL